MSNVAFLLELNNSIRLRNVSGFIALKIQLHSMDCIYLFEFWKYSKYLCFSWIKNDSSNLKTPLSNIDYLLEQE